MTFNNYDDYLGRATILLATEDARRYLALNNTTALASLIESLIRECAHQAAANVYLLSLTAGRVAERARCLEIAKSVTDNAAGDTTLGKTIIKRIEEGK